MKISEYTPVEFNSVVPSTLLALGLILLRNLIR